MHGPKHTRVAYVPFVQQKNGINFPMRTLKQSACLMPCNLLDPLFSRYYFGTLNLYFVVFVIPLLVYEEKKKERKNWNCDKVFTASHINLGISYLEDINSTNYLLPSEILAFTFKFIAHFIRIFSLSLRSFHLVLLCFSAPFAPPLSPIYRRHPVTI